MFGKSELEIWGAPVIIFNEFTVDNKVFCAYGAKNEVYTIEYNNTNLLKLLVTGYVLKNNMLIFTKPEFVIPKFNYAELPLDLLKILHFSYLEDANEFIEIFGIDFLINGNICAKVSESNFINYWNTANIPNPIIWGTLANYCVKNYFYIVKYLNVKAIDLPKLETIKYLCFNADTLKFCDTTQACGKYSFKVFGALSKFVKQNKQDIKIVSVTSFKIKPRGQSKN